MSAILGLLTLGKRALHGASLVHSAHSVAAKLKRKKKKRKKRRKKRSVIILKKKNSK